MSDAGPRPNLVRLAWSQGALFVVAGGIYFLWSHATSNDIRSAFLYVGLTLGQVAVAVTWLVLGADVFIRRICTAVGVWLFTLGAWCFGDLQSHTPLSGILPIQVKICGGMGLLLLIPLSVMRHFGMRWGRRCSAQCGKLQFGLRDLLALTAATAVVLGVLRIVAFAADWSEPGHLWYLFATVTVGASLVALSLLGAVCTRRRLVVILVALVAPFGWSVVEVAIMTGKLLPDGSVDFLILNGAAAAVLLAHGWAARWAGFGLVRQTVS